MALSFHAIADDDAGAPWLRMVHTLWPAYRRWYLSDPREDRPGFAECQAALREHMPEWHPEWLRLVALAGGDELFALFLSGYQPPAYLSSCSQAVWPGAEPMLVRNYDYSSTAFDAVCLHTRWGARTVMGSSDCLAGLVDGINDAGLALSLTFGGRRELGRGFGVPMILRYVLQTCSTTPEAGAALKRLPCHMAYNVTVVDTERRVLTAQLAPGQPALLTHAPVATNHQTRSRGEHAHANATVERERYLLARLMLHDDTAEHFIGAFLRPPLYSLAFERGFGTLFTAAYWPQRLAMCYHWPQQQWPLSLQHFESGSRQVRYPALPARSVTHPR